MPKATKATLQLLGQCYPTVDDFIDKIQEVAPPKRNYLQYKAIVEALGAIHIAELLLHLREEAKERTLGETFMDIVEEELAKDMSLEAEVPTKLVANVFIAQLEFGALEAENNSSELTYTI